MNTPKLFRAALAAVLCTTALLEGAPISTGCLSVSYPPVPKAQRQSLLRVVANFESGNLNSGTYGVYCLNQHVDVDLAVNYSFATYEPSDSAVGSIVTVIQPANLPLVEFILNQNYPGQVANDLTVFNSDDVQGAIWQLLDGSIDPAALPVIPASSVARITQIVEEALVPDNAQFSPGCGQLKAYILNPVALGCGLGQGLAHQPSFAQPMIMATPLECPVLLDCVAVTSGQVGSPYASALVASGGNPDYTYSIIDGALPDGLVLDSTTGAITGTATVAGAFNFTASVVDSVGNSANHSANIACAITIESPQLTLDCVALGIGQVGQPYVSSLTTAGGVAPFAFIISAGSLPTGLTLDSVSGEISGVPSASGTFSFTAVVTDSVGNTGSHLASANCSITVENRDSKQYCVQEASVLTAGNTLTPSHALQLPGIGNDFIFGNSPGQLLDHGDGTATLTGNLYSRSNPTLGWQVSVVLTGLTMPPAPAPLGSPVLALSPASYSPAGPIDPATWSYQTGLTGTLTGLGEYFGAVLQLSQAGSVWQEGLGANGKNLFYGASAGINVVVESQPTTGTINVTEAGEFNLNIALACPSPVPELVLTCPAGVNGSVGTPYSAAWGVSGGVAPYSFSITTGNLPPGLSFNPSTGLISGTPSAAGTFNFTMAVADYTGVGGSQTASASCAITIAAVCPPLSLACVSSGTGSVGTVYASNLHVSGGTAPYVFSISGGNLPPGLSLNQATGTISGTPTTGGTYSFTAKVVDASGSVCDCNKQATVTCSIVITSNCPPITLGCVSTGTGTVGTTYLGSFSVNGGLAPFTFSIVSGALPGGLGLNTATGVISGTPTTAGTYTFTAKVKGANSLTCGCYGYDTVCCSIKISPSICPPPTCSSLVAGDTATIGYWNGPNGQALINSLNGGPSSTQLGRWLANEFPHLFGANAGSDNLAGKSNSQVAYKFRSLFQVKGQKFMAQTLASALAVYVTDSDLAGNIAVASGFNVSTAGTGTKCYNVGSSGSTAGLSNNKNYTVMALLKQANLKKKQGCFSATAFNSIFDGINRKGDRL